MNLKEIIKECIEIELEEGLHLDTMDDYSTRLDFYLSNIVGEKKEEYMNHLVEYYGLSNSLSSYVYEEVVDYIKNNY